MIENLETLLALARAGTMSQASTQLRIAQSTVSKRIAKLEKYYGRTLIQKQGRRVELTTSGQQLVTKAPALLSQLRDLLEPEQADGGGELVIGVSESILSSWGPASFLRVQQQLENTELVYHAHRSTLVVDRIRSGEFMLGVCAGSLSLHSDLQSELLFEEAMVVIPANLQHFSWPHTHPLDVISIEDNSGSWRAIVNQTQQHLIHRTLALESFFSVAQMAVAGFGHGLVPVGVARALNIPASVLMTPNNHHQLSRPVQLVARKSTYAKPQVARFYRQLLAALPTAP